MKIRTIAVVAWIISLAAVLSAGIAILSATIRNDEAARTSERVTAIVRAFNERQLLFYKYLRSQRPEYAIEWQTLFDATVSMLQSTEFKSDEEAALLADIREDNVDMQRLFATLVGIRNPITSTPTKTLLNAREEQLTTAMEVLNVHAVGGAYRLEEINKRNRADSRRMIMLISSIAVGLLSGLGLANIAILSFRVVRPLTGLNTSIQRFAQGDFNHRTNITSNDEIGAIGRSFDSMARSLQALRCDLENKVHDLAVIMEVLPVGIVYFDQDMRYRFCNPLFATWTNRKAEDVIGKTLQEVISAPDSKWIEPRMKAALAGKKESLQAKLHVENVEMDVRVELMPDLVGDAVCGCTVMIVNITDIVAAQRDLRMAKAAADAANEAKSAFLANISHELRTPIGVMLGYAEMIALEAERPEIRDAADIVYRNGRNLLVLLNDILDLSKVEARRLEIERKKFALGPFLHDLIQLHNFKAEEKGLRIEVDILGAVPAVIETDAGRFRQILTNVIGNAIKFTSSGKIKITLRADVVDGCLDILVADTGLGIAAENQLRIFEPFTQAENYITRRFGGTGLGLSLSRELARALGGDLFLTESTLGKGATFAVRIAMGDVDRKNLLTLDSNRTVQKLSPLPTKKQLTGLRILLVEDSADMQALLRKQLSAQGAVVDTASDGKTGIESAIGATHDVVLMDLQMPVMDGYSAIKALRRLNYNRPVIALTAHAMSGEAERCTAAGFTDYLTKPVDRQQLFTMVKQYGGLRGVSSGSFST